MSTLPVANNKSLESWIWDAACSIHGAKDALEAESAKTNASLKKILAQLGVGDV